MKRIARIHSTFIKPNGYSDPTKWASKLSGHVSEFSERGRKLEHQWEEQIFLTLMVINFIMLVYYFQKETSRGDEEIEAHGTDVILTLSHVIKWEKISHLGRSGMELPEQSKQRRWVTWSSREKERERESRCRRKEREGGERESQRWYRTWLVPYGRGVREIGGQRRGSRLTLGFGFVSHGTFDLGDGDLRERERERFRFGQDVAYHLDPASRSRLNNLHDQFLEVLVARTWLVLYGPNWGKDLSRCNAWHFCIHGMVSTRRQHGKSGEIPKNMPSMGPSEGE